MQAVPPGGVPIWRMLVYVIPLVLSACSIWLVCVWLEGEREVICLVGVAVLISLLLLAGTVCVRFVVCCCDRDCAVVPVIVEAEYKLVNIVVIKCWAVLGTSLQVHAWYAAAGWHDPEQRASTNQQLQFPTHTCNCLGHGYFTNFPVHRQQVNTVFFYTVIYCAPMFTPEWKSGNHGESVQQQHPCHDASG